MINIVDPLAPNFVPGAINIWKFIADKNPDLVESMRNVKAGLATKIPARKCRIKHIDVATARAFLDDNHLMGYAAAELKFGLFLDELLVMVATIGKSRFNKDFDFELIRMASLRNTVVVGGAAKLIKNILVELPDASIMTFSENMLGAGEVYSKIGFEYIGETQAGYFYVKDDEIISRSKARKSNLVSLFPEITEADLIDSEANIMMKHGYSKITDMGNKRWVINKNNSVKFRTYKFHYLYKITRPLIDDKFYIGVHSTNSLSDGYLGSGILITRSIKKYGAALHQLEILEHFENRYDLMEAERSMVSATFIADDKCLNITEGGGNLVSCTSGNSGMIFIHHPTNPKHGFFIAPDDFLVFESRGFKKGKGVTTKIGSKLFYYPNTTKILRGFEVPEGAIEYIKKTTSKFKWVNRNGERKFIPESEVLPNDEVKFIPCINLDKRMVIKNNFRKYVHESEISNYLNDGWAVGGGACALQDKVQIKKGDDCKFVSESEAIDLIINHGWELKRKQLKTAPDQVIRVAKAIGMRMPKTKLLPGEINAPKPKNKKGASTGKIGIRKDGIKKLVLPDQAKELVSNDGWELAAASCWRLANEIAKELGRELGYDVENNQKTIHE